MTPAAVHDSTLLSWLSLGLLALAPLALLTLTSFVKISVVLSILRSALGAAQVPPSSVVTALALLLTVYVMAPVAQAACRNARPALAGVRPQDAGTARGVSALVGAADRGKEPVRAFLLKHAHLEDRRMFLDLARRLREPADREGIHDTDFLVAVPAFITSELQEAFQIGFLLFVPFLVIDLVVANILLALGLGLSPGTVSLPFKLLLFVLVGGWQLLARGLVEGYL